MRVGGPTIRSTRPQQNIAVTLHANKLSQEIADKLSEMRKFVIEAAVNVFASLDAEKQAQLIQEAKLKFAGQRPTPRVRKKGEK